MVLVNPKGTKRGEDEHKLTSLLTAICYTSKQEVLQGQIPQLCEVSLSSAEVLGRWGGLSGGSAGDSLTTVITFSP